MTSLKRIGRGSYSEVYELNEKEVLKSMTWYTKHGQLNGPAIRDLAFLTTYSHPNIAALTGIDESDPDKLQLKLESGGVPMPTYFTKLTLKQRLKLLPDMVMQVASVLAYLEKNDLIHGDLSLANITHNPQTNTFKVIDWGGCICDATVVKVCESPFEFRRCTIPFSSPEMEKPHKYGLTPKHDVFSLGMCIIQFIMGKYIDNSAHLDQLAFTTYLIPPLVENALSFKWLMLVRSMLRRDLAHRISATQLVAYFLPQPATKTFPFPTRFYYGTRYVPANYIKQQKDINLSMRKILIEWMAEVLGDIKASHILVLAVALLDRFLSRYQVRRDDLQLLGTIAVILSECVIDACALELSRYIWYTRNTYTMERLKQDIQTFVAGINGMLFHPLFDRALRKRDDHIDYKVIKLICLDTTRSVYEPIPTLIQLYDQLREKKV